MIAKAYSYIRFSTPEQARGDSLRRQTEKAASWCKERGIELDDTLRDLGVSAYHGANRTTGALRSFLQLVESGKVVRGSYLIVESLDRISRETVMDAASRLFDLIRAGIIVVTLSDGQEYSEERLRTDWTPLLFSLIVMARAHEESRIKSERVGEAWKQKKAAARSKKIPITKRCPEWLSIEGGKFVINEERAKIVYRIFEATIDGFGRRAISRRMNELGIPAFRGKKGWQISSIAKILSSKAVLGEYQPHAGRHSARNRTPQGEPILDYYPPIIKEEMFWQAQSAVTSRQHGSAGRTGVRGAHILKGLAKCGECQSVMHISNKGPKPKGGVYLVCENAKRKMGCENAKHYRVDETERKLLHALSQLVAEDIDFKRNEANQGSEVISLEAQLADKESVRDKLLRLVETTDFDEALNERFQQTATELKEIKAKLKKAKADLKMVRSEYDSATRKALLDDLLADIESVDTQKVVATKVKLNAIIRGIVDHVKFSRLPGIQMTITNRSRFHIDTDGTYLTKGGQGIGTIVLLEENASDEAFEAFFGVPRSSFDWD
ncbi:recombinase family protein [Ensifer adhaerens]|uniref:recombinase family protein n=1 Tax=Ensifer adhaerens TaxID=106592 RepID=UPI0023A9CEB1|nr:recombinase family protein [Ensifer adhaerens]WDZ76886.1 recombinase family protein [Ensifer adhaerens]